MTKKKWTLTSSFLLPLLGVDSIVNRGLINAYAGYYPYTGEDWGKNIYLLMQADISNDVKELLQGHKQYVSTIRGKDTLLFEFKLDDQAYNNNVIDKFLNGAYSQIDKKYVTEKFPKLITDPFTNKEYVSTNYQILNKWDVLKQFWEERIGVELPKDAEVWDRPEKNKEIYLYESR